MIILRCDMDGCNNVDIHGIKVFSMSQEFKEKFNHEAQEHICQECLNEHWEEYEPDGYSVDMGTLMVNEDDREDYNEVDK